MDVACVVIVAWLTAGEEPASRRVSASPEAKAGDADHVGVVLPNGTPVRNDGGAGQVGWEIALRRPQRPQRQNFVSTAALPKR